MARRADYIIIANCFSEGAGATDISDPSTRVMMTLFGPRYLKFSRNVYRSCGEDYTCLEIFAFLPPKSRSPSPPLKSEEPK